MSLQVMHIGSLIKTKLFYVLLYTINIFLPPEGSKISFVQTKEI